jgi:peroxiredoxin
MDSLQGLANRYNGKQLNIIGISTDDFRNDALSLIKKTGISFENFLDNKLQMEKMLGANMIPLTVLVDEQGRILEKVQGARDWNSPDMVDAIGEVFQLKLRD